MEKFHTTLAITLLTVTLQAQTFNFSLTYIGLNDSTGNYEVALIATPDFTETSGNSADMGAIVSMSDNVYIQPTGFVNDCVFTPPATTTCEYAITADEWSTEYIGATGGRYYYQLIRTETGESTFFDAVSGTPIILAVFQIYPSSGGNPTTGDFSFVAEGDSNVNPFNENWMNIRYATATSNVTTNLFNILDPAASTISFSTLGTADYVLENISIYPNPVQDILYIKGLETELKQVNIYTLTGKKVKTITHNLETLDVSKLSTGLYLVTLITDNASKTLKLVKE